MKHFFESSWLRAGLAVFLASLYFALDTVAMETVDDASVNFGNAQAKPAVLSSDMEGKMDEVLRGHLLKHRMEEVSGILDTGEDQRRQLPDRLSYVYGSRNYMLQRDTYEPNKKRREFLNSIPGWEEHKHPVDGIDISYDFAFGADYSICKYVNCLFLTGFGEGDLLDEQKALALLDVDITTKRQGGYAQLELRYKPFGSPDPSPRKGVYANLGSMKPFFGIGAGYAYQNIDIDADVSAFGIPLFTIKQPNPIRDFYLLYEAGIEIPIGPDETISISVGEATQITDQPEVTVVTSLNFTKKI